MNKGASIMASRQRIPSWNIAGRPKKAKRGTIGFNFKTNTLEYWDGTKWLTLAMTPIKIEEDVVPSGEIPEGKG